MLEPSMNGHVLQTQIQDTLMWESLRPQSAG